MSIIRVGGRPVKSHKFQSFPRVCRSNLRDGSEPLPRNSVRLNTNALKEIQEGGFGKAQFVQDNLARIQDVYSMEKQRLGEGSYGSVCKGTHKATGVVRAIKTIPKAKVRNVERFKNEISIMKIMDHPNIIKLFETFEDNRNVYLAMELCSGGELFDHIIEAGYFKEVDAAVVMQQILRAIFYLHGQHIAHRDLKPENFLFTSKDAIENNTLKIIDFGLSTPSAPGQIHTTRTGTPMYLAPQVLQGKYDRLCDLWSCGVIMYILLSGRPPFAGATDDETFQKIRVGRVNLSANTWDDISDDGKELIHNLLKRRASERYNAQQALEDPWITLLAPRASDVELPSGMLDHLAGFHCDALSIDLFGRCAPTCQCLTTPLMQRSGYGSTACPSMAEIIGKALFSIVRFSPRRAKR